MTAVIPSPAHDPQGYLDYMQRWCEYRRPFEHRVVVSQEAVQQRLMRLRSLENKWSEAVRSDRPPRPSHDADWDRALLWMSAAGSGDLVQTARRLEPLGFGAKRAPTLATTLHCFGHIALIPDSHQWRIERSSVVRRVIPPGQPPSWYLLGARDVAMKCSLERVEALHRAPSAWIVSKPPVGFDEIENPAQAEMRALPRFSVCSSQACRPLPSIDAADYEFEKYVRGKWQPGTPQDPGFYRAAKGNRKAYWYFDGGRWFEGPRTILRFRAQQHLWGGAHRYDAGNMTLRVPQYLQPPEPYERPLVLAAGVRTWDSGHLVYDGVSPDLYELLCGRLLG